MFATIHSCLLLADRSLLRDMGSGFRDRREHFDPIDLWPWIVVVAVVIGGLAILSRWLTRRDAQGFYHSPGALFRALCHAHGLGRADCRLLHLIARARGLESPSQLFLLPEAFELDDDSPEPLAEYAEAIAALGTRLFPGDPESSESDGASEQTPDASAATSVDEDAAVNAMIDEGSPAARDIDGASPGEPMKSAESAAAATSSNADPRSATRKASDFQPKTTWAAAPSLFEPIPAVVSPAGVSPGKAASSSSRAERSSDGLAEDHATTFTEHQAMKALETLMRQINANRDAAAAIAPGSATVAAARPAGANPAPLGAIAETASIPSQPTVS